MEFDTLASRGKAALTFPGPRASHRCDSQVNVKLPVHREASAILGRRRTNSRPPSFCQNFGDLRSRARVVLSPRGHQWQEGNFSRAWRRLRTKAVAKQIRPLKLHCARHTFATLALEGGRSIRWVAETLGHADPALTLRTYAHVLDREDDDMAFLSGTEQMRNKSEQTVPVAGSDKRKG